MLHYSVQKTLYSASREKGGPILVCTVHHVIAVFEEVAGGCLWQRFRTKTYRAMANMMV